MISINDDFLRFVATNATANPAMLRLKYSSADLGFDVATAIDQIECRRKAAHKLPDFLKYAEFYFPTVLSSEQASHQEVARLHATLCQKGDKVVDMTAGLGIDAMTMARAGAAVCAIDIDPRLTEALEHNARILGLDNVAAVCADSPQYLESRSDIHPDIIFIDPARRDNASRRTYAFADCTPDISALAPRLLDRCKTLVIKASPMLDVTQALTEIPCVRELWCVCVKGECKEITLIASRKGDDEILFKAIDITADGIAEFAYKAGDIGADIVYANEKDFAGKWLFEPNAAIMKMGCWRQLSATFPGLKKLDANTHLFIADCDIPDFPGRRLLIDKCGSASNFKGFRGNVAVRNHPLSAQQLAAKIKATPGDDSRFLYGVRAGGRPLLISAVKSIS